MDLLRVVTIEEAKILLRDNFSSYKLKTERIPAESAVGRVLASDVASSVPVPDFRRSTRDGYAVRAVDVSGASDTLPAFLTIRGNVSMGQPAGFKIGPGEAAYVPTGGMIPEGADSVVMVEYSEMLTDDEVSIFKPSSVRQHVINIGDDVKAGERILKAGRRLKPADIGVLTSIGCADVEVYRKPVITVISTGDEIAAPDADIRPGQVRDINTYTIAAAAEEAGCDVRSLMVINDDRKALTDALISAHGTSDIVVLSGGSSVGVKDYSLDVIASLGKPGVLCHGIAFKPGKPTIIANAGGKPVIGLPGHPVSALLVFGVIGRYLINLISRSPQPAESYINAELTENLNGAPGREAWQVVRLEEMEGDDRGELSFRAVPIHGESGLISVLSDASGTVRIPRNVEGYSKGTNVRVYML